MKRKKCVICKTKPANKFRSRHHLKPKWGNGDTRRAGKKDMCIDCHRDIHHLFSNGELYETYNTVDELRYELNHRRMQRALAPWFELIEGKAKAPVVAMATHLPCKQKIQVQILAGASVPESNQSGNSPASYKNAESMQLPRQQDDVGSNPTSGLCL